MHNNLRRLLVIVFCLVLTFSLAACGGKTGSGSSNAGSSSADTPADESSGETSAKTELNVAVSLDCGTLDPVYITGSGGWLNVYTTYMEPLFNYHKDQVPEYLLAESIDTVSEIEYTLHLREGVVFNNGNPFTAEDVIFSIEREAADPSRMLDVQYVDLAKTNIVDDYTIDLWFTMFTPMNFIKLTQCMITDKESFNAEDMSLNPIGTGAYKVTNYVVNSVCTVEARDDYWGEPAAIKKINFISLNEESQVTNAIETGKVDYASIPPKDVEYVSGLGPYNIETFYGGWTTAQFYNMSPDGVLASKDARDAISYATDCQAMSDVAYSGYAELVKWPASMYNMDYEDRFGGLDGTYADGYDIDKAKELAEKSGLVGKTVRIITNGAAEYVTMAEILQASLLSIGIKAEIINYDQASLFAIIMDPSNYEVAFFTVSATSFLGEDVLATYPTFFTLGWNDAERLAYVEKGAEILSTFDDKTRSDMLLDYVKEFLTYSPWYATLDTPTQAAISKDIGGFEFWQTGELRFQYWYFTA